MNKHSFRTIFNAKRGMLMAVSEAATSNGKSAKGEGSGLITALGAMLLAAIPLTGIAQIIADPSAPRSQQAIVLPAGNGVPIVNIQTPTAGGVSMNMFSQFNVGTNGAILNNGRLNTQTQLAGWIQANPHLATGSASVIVNQVNSNNPTLLNGYIEVAGQRAQVIIANPSGINVNGAGFINAQSATLTTGTPNFNGNLITGYTVNQGTVQVSGAGLDASTTDYTAILARAVQINAGLWAKNLDVVAGANQINVSSVAATPTGISAATPTGAAPFFAIDVSSLGGMYAGKIMLIGTEAGLGFKNSGTIMGTNASLYAGAGEVTISVDGILSNSGRIQSDTAMTTTLGSASTGGLVNSGTIYAGANSAVTTNGNASNSGVIAAQGNLALTANGANSNINSTSASTLAAGISASGTLGTPSSSTGNLQVSATQSISANGQNLAAQNLSLSAQTINLSGSNTYANNINIAVSSGNLVIDNTNLTAGNLLALSTPTLLSTQNSNVSAAQLNFNAHDWDNTAGNVTHTGTGDLTVNLAGNLTNAQGKIQANAAHTNLTAANLNNTGGLISGQAINLVTSATPAAQTLTNTNGTIYARQDLTVSSGGLGNNLGIMQSVGNLSVNTHNGNLTSNQGQIQSQQSIVLNAGTGNIASTQGLIRTAKDIIITAASLDNSNTQGANQGIEATNITVSTTNLNNNLGAIRADMGAGLGANLNLNSGGTITNNQGLLSSTGKLNITDTGTTLAVTSTGGKIISNDALQIRSSSLDNTDGTVAGLGVTITTKAVPAQTLTNTNGTIYSKADMTLSSGALGNDKGLIQTVSNLSLNTNGATLTNTHSGAAGGIVSGGLLTLQSGAANSAAGFISAAGDVNLTATSLDNTQGQIQSAQNVSVNSASGQVTNSQGLMRAAKSVTINAATLDNSNTLGANQGIEAANITVAATSINNNLGAVRADMGAGLGSNLNLNSGGTITNNQGLLSSAGKLNITDTGAALAITSTGGTMVSGDNLTVRAVTLDNTNGFIVGQNVSLTTQALPAQTFTNTNGTIFSRADTVISSGSLGNDKGLIQAAGNLSINTNGATLTNTNSGAAGLLSGGALNVQSSLIDNTAGRILTNGDINLTATNLNNLQAGSIKTASNLTLAVSSLTDNTGGTLSAAGALTLNQSGASLVNNGGNISASNGVTLVLQSLNNTNGQIATTAGSNSDVNITANTLDNTNGKIGSDRDIRITAPNWVGAATGAGYGTVVANRDLSITTTGNHVLGTPAFASNRDLSFTTTGTLSNSNTVQAVRNLSLNASDITNTGNIYAGELLKANSTGSITNSGSVIGGEVNLKAVGNITNAGTAALIGATNSSGALTLSAANVINTDDTTATDTSATTTIYGAGVVNITAGNAIINRSALIESGGDMKLTAGVITNTRRTLTMSGVFDQSVDPAVISALNISMSGTTGQTNVHNASSIGGVYVEPPHGGRMNSDYFFTSYTGVASQNSVLTVSPKAQIISGGNLNPNSPLFQNYWSQVASAGNVNITGVSLDQDGFKSAPISQIKIAYTGTYNYRTYRGEPWTHSFCDSGCSNPGDNRYYTASTYDSSFTSLGAITGTGTTINNGARSSASIASQGLNYAITTSGNQNAASTNAVGGQAAPAGLLGATPTNAAISAPARAGSVPLPALLQNIRVPSGGLFAPTTRVGATYLIESNPQLTSYKNWLSSDYLLAATNFDPALTQKRLGDGFYEQRLVRDQISQLTGKRFLDGYSDEEAEYKSLMDSAVTASKQFNLRPGVALTAEQAAQLTSDIVWLVETEVTLPNGSKVKALAPQVYLSKLGKNNIRPDGNLIAAAGDIDLKDLKGFTNAGTLQAGKNLNLQTDGSLDNSFGTLSSGRMMTLAAGKDIDLTSSTVRASALSLTAGQDILLATAKQTQTVGNSFSRTTLGQTASIAVTGDTSITTGRNFNMAGATLATGGNLNVSTGGNWNIGTVQANEAKSGNSFGGAQSSNFTTNQGSTVTVGGNTRANVGGDLNVSGSTLNLGANSKSTATIAVAGNVSITAVKDTAKVDSSYNAGKASGTYNTFDETVKGSALTSNGSITLTSMKDLTVVGSNINAQGNTRIAAAGNVTIAAERELHTLDSKDSGSKGGVGGKSETKTTAQDLTIIQSGVSGSNVSIVSLNGNVILEAAKVEATNNLNVSATNGVVALLSATSHSYFQQDKKESNVAIQRMSGSGTLDKTVITTNLKYGTLVIDANKIIADLPASKAADELAKQPGMAWINTIQNDPALAGKIDWKKIDEVHKNWAYDKTTMTPAMASLVTIALAVATGGAGATLVGATAGSMGAAVASAAFTSLVTQATIGLINNGGDLGKTLQQLGSSESIRGLVTSMATAAAMSYVSNMDFMRDMTAGPNGLPVKFADLDFAQKLGVSVTNAATGAVTRTALNGGSLGDALVTAIGSGLTTALAAQGANSLHLNPDQQSNLMAQVGNKLGHALIGCAAAKANSAGNNCQAGAMGAVIGETAAELLAKSPAEVDAMNKVERQAYESSLVNTTKLISASIAAAAGLDPNAAALASSNAVENNFLGPVIAAVGVGGGAYAYYKFFSHATDVGDAAVKSRQMDEAVLKWVAEGAIGKPPFTQQELVAAKQEAISGAQGLAADGAKVAYGGGGSLSTYSKFLKLLGL